jgi:hypothetical protein
MAYKKLTKKIFNKKLEKIWKACFNKLQIFSQNDLEKYDYLGQNMDDVHVHGMVKKNDF